MEDIVEVSFLDIEENEKYIEEIKRVIKKCFDIEDMNSSKLYVSITLTDSENIKSINKTYRKIDKPTDVLSFPMFQKEELEQIIKSKENRVKDVLGDIVISIQKVYEQANEYGHSFEREFAYMLVHGFYHLMGYDHIEEKDKAIMRPKEEKVLQELNITRKEQ